MAQSQSKTENYKPNVGGDATFHDFLGKKAQTQQSAPPAVAGGPSLPEVSPSATADLGSGGERPRWPHDEMSFGMNQMRPISSSFSSTGGRTDVSPSKWDQAAAVNPGSMLQCPPRNGNTTPFGYQGMPNRSKDTNFGPLMSQTAADEGSRIGMKGSGVLSSINATGAVSVRQPAGVLVPSGKQKSGVGISEPDSSTTPSQRGTESPGRQMTIFYGGQAHVFDNVHPNKADVIMALAGSNGGSWSTMYMPNSSTGENSKMVADGDAGIAILKELQGRPSDKGCEPRFWLW